MNGGWGLNVLGGIQLLQDEDSDGKQIVDDGLHTITSLQTLMAEWKAKPDLNPMGQPWDPKLESVFKLGVYVTIVSYGHNAADSMDLREAWQAARHDEENNKYRPTAVYQKIDIVMKAVRRFGDFNQAQAQLVKLYGYGRRSTVARWVRRQAQPCPDPTFGPTGE